MHGIRPSTSPADGAGAAPWAACSLRATSNWCERDLAVATQSLDDLLLEREQGRAEDGTNHRDASARLIGDLGNLHLDRELHRDRCSPVLRACQPCCVSDIATRLITAGSSTHATTSRRGMIHGVRDCLREIATMLSFVSSRSTVPSKK